MRTVVCQQHGGSEVLAIEQKSLPEINESQVLIAVKTVGINYVDGLLIAGTYQIKVPTPFVPGSDLAAEVVAVGAKVEGFAIGDKVLASVGIGALSEMLAVDPSQISKTPNGMSDALAATFLQSNGTAYFGLVNCAAIIAGESVLVLGAAGGTGMATIHIAKALGAKVIAAASTDIKLQACRDAGADETINYVTEDLKTRAKALSGGGGVDIVFDPVGGDFAEPALRACAPGARFLVVGFAGGPIPNIPLNLPLLKRCSIIGVNWGASYSAEPALLDEVNSALINLFNAGELKEPPITEFAMEAVGEALDALHGRRLAGRAVVRLAAS